MCVCIIIPFTPPHFLLLIRNVIVDSMMIGAVVDVVVVSAADLDDFDMSDFLVVQDFAEMLKGSVEARDIVVAVGNLEAFLVLMPIVGLTAECCDDLVS